MAFPAPNICHIHVFIPMLFDTRALFQLMMPKKRNNFFSEPSRPGSSSLNEMFEDNFKIIACAGCILGNEVVFKSHTSALYLIAGYMQTVLDGGSEFHV